MKSQSQESLSIKNNRFDNSVAIFVSELLLMNCCEGFYVYFRSPRFTEREQSMEATKSVTNLTEFLISLVADELETYYRGEQHQINLIANLLIFSSFAWFEVSRQMFLLFHEKESNAENQIMRIH